MDVIVKDFMGNELKVGDKVVTAGATMSKTPYLIYGVITEIKDPIYFKNGNLDHVSIKIDVIGKSDDYRSCFENNNYQQTQGRKTGFNYSDKCYINIMKVQ